ncbi:MAG: hypothetical protein LBI03_05945 [Clostridiales bacterium]|jgi:hypothetical protein|nr:hypothetical protein [Clostridiales bacterium]
MKSQTVLDFINKVEFCGAIVHKYRADNWLVVTLAVSVTSGTKDHPKVYWYDDMVDQIDESYQVGDRVEIVGRLRTSKAYPATSIIGETITPTAGWFDAKFNQSGEYKPDHNEVLLKGTFVRAYIPPQPELTIITLKIVMDGYIYFPQVSCFGRHAIKAAELKEEDTVCIVARIQTKKRDTEEGPQYYQTVVCRNMRVL